MVPMGDKMKTTGKCVLVTVENKSEKASWYIDKSKEENSEGGNGRPETKCKNHNTDKNKDCLVP